MPRTAKTHDRTATPTRTRTPRTAAKKTTRTHQPSGKLLPGQLQTLVLDHVQRHPDQDWSPGQVAKALDRSTGAVGNALETFVNRGLLTRTSTSPRRYQAVKATATSTTKRTKSRRTSPPRTTPDPRARKGTKPSRDAGTQPHATSTPTAATVTDSPPPDVSVTDVRSGAPVGTDAS
jgi:nitric oxide reductase NorQ protein